jgi:hypothetical protein
MDALIVQEFVVISLKTGRILCVAEVDTFFENAHDPAVMGENFTA